MTILHNAPDADALATRDALASAAAPSSQREGSLRAYAVKTLSVISLVGVWYVAAARLPATVMPAPHAVIEVLWEEVTTGPIWTHVLITLRRIAMAFSLAMSAALVLGFAMGIWKTAERFFEVWILTAMIVPSLVIILTVYMAMGLNDAAAIVGAAVPVIPIVTINIWESIKAVDAKLVDMAKVYRAERPRIIRSVLAPQIAPTLFASARFGLGLVWKTVLFVELLGRSDGIGYQIQFYYQLFNMSEVLAYALLFLIIMLVLEIGVMGALEARFFKWRAPPRRI